MFVKGNAYSKVSNKRGTTAIFFSKKIHPLRAYLLRLFHEVQKISK